MLQVKELEEAKEAIVKQLSEAQSALADLSASPPSVKPAQTEAKTQIAGKVAKTAKPKAKKATEKVSAKQAALDTLADVKPYQVHINCPTLDSSLQLADCVPSLPLPSDVEEEQEGAGGNTEGHRRLSPRLLAAPVQGCAPRPHHRACHRLCEDIIWPLEDIIWPL